MAITTSTDEAAEDGEKRVSASFDEGTEQVLTVGDEEVAADHLGAASSFAKRSLAKGHMRREPESPLHADVI